jgi:drug/metabolite transporter (DMT)-like permease
VSWLALALLASFFVATADAVVKRYLGHLPTLDLVLIRFFWPGLLFIPWLMLEPFPALPGEFYLWLAFLVPLEFVAMFLYMGAIRSSPLGKTIPLLALTPVFNVLTGALFLGETVSGGGLAGIGLVTAGTYLLNSEATLGSSKALGMATLMAPLRAIFDDPGARAMVVVALLYSVTSVLAKGAMAYTTPAFFGPFYYASLGAVAFGIGLAARPRHTGRILSTGVGPQILVGCLLLLMAICYFLAIAKVSVAYLVAVKRANLLFGILSGVLWFGEAHLARHLLAGVILIAGIVCIVVAGPSPG